VARGAASLVRSDRSSVDLVQEVVLPFAFEQGPQPGGLDARPSLLEAMLLDALTDAGLVERESDGAGGRRRQGGEARYRVTPLLESFITFDLDAEVEGQ